MKRIIYQIVVAKTSEDNEKMNYEYVYRSPKEDLAIEFAQRLRAEHPEYAFIVLEERHEHKDFSLWELEQEKVIDHF